MSTFVVLATGPSMSQEIADFVRGRCRVVAVCNAYQLAPWADALVCNDRKWWQVHADALAFAGEKYCAVRNLHGVEYMQNTAEFQPGTNSGLQGMRVARLLGATRILLCGFDMHGTHYFGPHPVPLRNTSKDRFRIHVAQFKRWKGGCEVLNCTPGSSITQFPFADLRTLLGEAERAA